MLNCKRCKPSQREEMQQQAEQVKHNFSIIIADYIRLGRMANVQHSQKQASTILNRAASNKQLVVAYRNAETRLQSHNKFIIILN